MIEPETGAGWEARRRSEVLGRVSGPGEVWRPLPPLRRRRDWMLALWPVVLMLVPMVVVELCGWLPPL